MIIATTVSDLTFANQVRFCLKKMRRGGEICFFTLGRRSYLNPVRVEGFGAVHVLMGNYCSVAHSVKFLLNGNHAWQSVTTYPLASFGVIPQAPAAAPLKRNINRAQVIIGHDVWIGQYSMIMGGVVIGNGAVVGANAMVTKDVPPYAVVAGNPARIVKYRFDQETAGNLQRIKWWYWEEERLNEYRELLNFPQEFASKCAPAAEGLEATETAAELRRLRHDGWRLFYFAPDFSDMYPLWPKVIKEYLKKFSRRDRTLLVLGVPPFDRCQKEVEEIQRQFQAGGATAAAIMLTRDQESTGLRLDIIQNVDYFITTRSFRSLAYVDFGWDYQVKCLSGLDEIVFDIG